MTQTVETLELKDDELRFFRVTCDLFTTNESPLRYLDEMPFEVDDGDNVFASLKERGLIGPNGAGAAPKLLERLQAVGECDARVVLRIGSTGERSRNFYVGIGMAVEYHRDGTRHFFGPPRTEAALAAELAQHFHASQKKGGRELRMSAGDYLVFAVFARDVRAAPAGQASDAMSLEEVLAYFDEPETKYTRTPNDESWNQSVNTLAKAGILVKQGEGWTLHASLHPLAREIVADHQRTVTRFDFLDEQWLVREVNLYPTSESVWRLGTEPDGSVLLHELSAASLADVLAAVVCTLPNLLNPDVPAMLKGADLQRGKT